MKQAKLAQGQLSPKLILSLLIFLLAVGVTLSATTALASNSSDSKSLNPSYAVNEHGQTLGTAFDSADPELQPDLIEAVATNGKEGYVLKEDLDEASHANEDFDELLESQETRKEVAASLLAEKMNESSNPITFTQQDAELALQTGLIPEEQLSQKHVMDAQGPQDTSAARIATIDDEELASLIAEVDQALTIYIPVYEDDGKTKVGVFPVSQL